MALVVDPSAHLRRAMRLEAIPDQNDLPADVSAKMAEKAKHPGRPDCSTLKQE
jgi:hypothetical protein